MPPPGGPWYIGEAWSLFFYGRTQSPVVLVQAVHLIIELIAGPHQVWITDYDSPGIHWA